MARQIIAVGMAKTGTNHIAVLYKKLFDANGIKGIAKHQWPLHELSPDIDFFTADWRLSLQMKSLSIKYPYVRFIILYRNVFECCSSLRNYYTGRGSPHKDYTAEQFAEDYWIKTYKSINKQIPDLKHRPLFLWTKDYFAGYYNKLLLDIYKLPVTKANLQIIDNHFKVPINRSRAYLAMSLNDDICIKCNQIGEDIRKKCIPSWTKGEIYG